MSKNQTAAVPPAIQSVQVKRQTDLLRLRISDMMTQLNTVIKTATDENAALKTENAGLKAKKQTGKS